MRQGPVVIGFPTGPFNLRNTGLGLIGGSCAERTILKSASPAAISYSSVRHKTTPTIDPVRSALIEGDELAHIIVM